MNKLIRYLVLLGCILGTFHSVSAQDGYAAVITVFREGVELKRANTEAWLALPIDAQAPLGAGDMLRTDSDGRAYLLFPPGIEMLLMSETTFELQNFAATSETGTQLAFSIDGQMIQRTAVDATIDSYEMETEFLTLTQPAALFSVWARPTINTIVTVAEGEAQGNANNDVIIRIPAESGVRASEALNLEARTLDYPYNSARLIGLLDGCAGDVETTEGLNLNVRAGPGFGATVIGNLPTDAITRIMGISESGNWYRVQALTGFAWVRSDLVESDCEDLPVLPNNTVENNLEASRVREAELEFLVPFFDTPEENLWFYRSLAG